MNKVQERLVHYDVLKKYCKKCKDYERYDREWCCLNTSIELMYLLRKRRNQGVLASYIRENTIVCKGKFFDAK